MTGPRLATLTRHAREALASMPPGSEVEIEDKRAGLRVVVRQVPDPVIAPRPAVRL